MTRAAVLLLLLGVVAGCASSESEGWTKPGASAEQIKRESADCILKAQIVLPGREGPRPAIDQERYRQCMATRGYTRAPVK